MRGGARFLLAMALLCGGAAAQPPPVPMLRVQHLMPPQSAQALELQALAARLEKARIARLTLEALDRSDGAGRGLVEAVRSGTLDIAVVPLASLGDFVPRFRAFEIPFLLRDERHAMALQFEDRDYKLLAELRAARVEPLGWWPGEALVLASRRPVLEPADLRGLRAASLASAAVGEASILTLLQEKLGAQPMRGPPAALAANLGLGTLDLVEGPLTELQRLALPKVSIALTRHLYTGYAVVANLARWANLPPTAREALRRELGRAHDDARRAVASAANEARRALEQERRAVFFDISPRDRGSWRNATRSERLASAAGDDFIRYAERVDTHRALMASRRGGTEISWNAWFEDGPESKPKDVTALEVNRLYRLSLDLSRYPYTAGFSAGVSPGIQEILAGQGERRLLLQPVLLGAQLGAAPGSVLAPRTLAVRPERAKAAPGDEAMLAKFDKGGMATRALSRQMSLGGMVSWELKAQAVGCAGIAVTVWDQARVTPLDHIVLHIPVRQGGAGPKDCASSRTAKSMNAGLLTLLAGPAPDASARAADAALHVFEHSEDGTSRSHAVLVHRQRLLQALADPKAADPGVYSWRLASALSTYVSESSQMPELVRAAHKAIAAPGGGRPFPFEDVAAELALKVFGGAGPHDRSEAARARDALRNAVGEAAEPAVVVRLVSAHGQTLYVPFGLLAAQAKKPEVSRRFTVIQPLAAPRAGRASCIDRWHIARPRDLQGVSGDARDLLRQAAEAPPASGITVIDNHASLAEYLATSDGAAQERGQGLLVLAHHDRGYLKFNDEDRPPSRIAREYIKRDFPPGSAAILAACTAAGDAAETRALIDQLAAQGVEALIVSPFAVDAEFGTRLALEFEAVVAEERAKRSGATLLRVFERASAKVASVYKSQGALLDMALEFMVIGNPELTLCK